MFSSKDLKVTRECLNCSNTGHNYPRHPTFKTHPTTMISYIILHMISQYDISQNISGSIVWHTQKLFFALWFGALKVYEQRWYADFLWFLVSNHTLYCHWFCDFKYLVEWFQLFDIFRGLQFLIIYNIIGLYDIIWYLYKIKWYQLWYIHKLPLPGPDHTTAAVEV